MICEVDEKRIQELLCYAESMGYLELTLEELEALPTLSESHTADLKFEQANCTERVWLERVGIAEGEWCNNKVTVEFLINGNWITIKEYEAL